MMRETVTPSSSSALDPLSLPSRMEKVGKAIAAKSEERAISSESMKR